MEKNTMLWNISLLIIAVITVIWSLCNIIGIKLSDTITRTFGILDLCALPILVYSSVKKKMK